MLLVHKMDPFLAASQARLSLAFVATSATRYEIDAQEREGTPSHELANPFRICRFEIAIENSTAHDNRYGEKHELRGYDLS